MNDEKGIIKESIRTLAILGKLDNKRLFLFGYNIFTGYINNFLCEENYELYIIIDNDKGKQGKKYCNISIAAPESIDWGKDDIVLIASRHLDDMTAQIEKLSEDVEIYSLINLPECKENACIKEKFWLERNYQSEIEILYRGEEVYSKLKNKDPIIIFLPALGDIFVGGLYLEEYKKKVKSQNIKIVISSKASYKVAQLFYMKNIILISEQEMDALVKFLLFNDVGNGNTVVCSCIHELDAMARYKGLPFPVFWAKYFFRLEDGYKTVFPCIWDKELKETELANKGMVRGKSVVLAPYANSIELLPAQFWEALAKRLQNMQYNVFTNIAGKQKPVKGTIGLEIPFHQIGSYLEYAGFFIALRSGLCDIAGQAQCRQIVIFRDRAVEYNGN